MAKKSIVARNKKRECLEAKVRAKRVSLKAEAKKAYAKGEIPWETLQKLQALPRNSHPTRIRNRCKLCGRGHAVYSKFGICRLCLRKYAMMGYVPGLKKASW